MKINEEVREALLARGDISHDSIQARVLVSKEATNTAKCMAETYQEGDVLRFNKSLPEYHIAPNTYWEVISRNLEKNEIAIKDKEGNIRFVRPDAHLFSQKNAIELYYKSNREFSTGDKVIIRREIFDNGIKNSQIGIINEVKDKSIQINIDNKNHKIDLTQYSSQHLDHGYAITSHSYQGSDTKRILLYMDTKYKNLSTHRSFYVGITRAENELSVYTDNLEKLREQIKESSSSIKQASKVGSKGHIELSSANHEQTRKYEVKKIIEVFNKDALNVAQALLGEPIKTYRGALLYGSNKGSLHIQTQGEKAGLWHDFQTGEGGNMLQLVQKERGHQLQAGA